MFVRVENVLNSDKYYLARVVAEQINRKGYASVGKFFEKLPESDMDILVDKIAQSTNSALEKDDLERRCSELLLLSMLLALAEGQDSFDSTEIQTVYKKMMLFTCVADLQRKKKVKALYDNFSFVDNTEKPIFEAVEESKG